MGSIVEELDRRTATDPDRPLFGFLNVQGHLTQSYTYSEFHRRSNFVARELVQSRFAHQGDPVLLVYPPGLEFAVAFYAAVKAGLIPVPVATPASSNAQVGLAKLAHVVADSGARVVLTDRRLRRRFCSPDADGKIDFSLLGAERMSNLVWIATDDHRGELCRFEPRHNPVLFLQYTSGSTRDPRGVAVTHDNILENRHLALNHEHPIGISWLPHFHDMGLIGYFLWAMIGGGSSYVFSPLDFLRRPLLWLEAISTFRGTITTAPNFAFDYCLREEKVPEESLTSIDLSSLLQLVNAAEPVRAATMNGFLDRFEGCGLDRSAVMADFGLAEHTLCVTAGGRVQIDVNRRLLERNRLRVETAGDSPARMSRLVSCGKPAQGVDLRIVDPDTARLSSSGEIGEIWVDSPSKAQGYWGKPELTQEVFHAGIRDLPAGRTYLRTGDMGFVHDGELYVCGRLKDMVVVHGQNIYPNDVEAFVEAELPEIVVGSVVVFGVAGERGCEGIAVLVEAKGNAPLPAPADIADVVSRGCQAPVRLAAIVARGSIARTSSGKISRASTQERWNGGDIEILDLHEPAPETGAPLTFQAYADNLFELAEGRGGDSATLEQLGLDSFELVTLSLHLQEFIEEQFGAVGSPPVDINDLRVLQSITIGRLRAFLELATAKDADPEGLLGLSTQAIGDVLNDETVLIGDDARLCEGWQRQQTGEGEGSGSIFITGATGFLGSYLLAELLERTRQDIHVLVRAQDREHGRNRVEAALYASGWRRTMDGADPWARLHIIEGDLTKTLFGLDAHRWDELADSVSAIYHCGAQVDYVRSYRAMRAGNVLGTREILAFAATGRRKRLHHMSTTFIFGWNDQLLLPERRFDSGMEDRDFGYAQTKWVAEQLVHQAVAGGLDARIYRSSLVTASSAGRYVRSDIVARVLGYMIRHRISTDAPNQMSFLPVDHCARNIAAISLYEDGPATCHVTADAHYAIGDACRIITAEFGYTFEYTDMAGFAEHMRVHCGPDDELYPLKPFIIGHVDRVNRMHDKRYDNTNYRRARDLADGAEAEPPLSSVVCSIVRFLQAEGLVPPVPSRRTAASF